MSDAKTLRLGALVGLVGAGMALIGYCPGTGIAAFGDGSRHAWAGVLGMLAGAALASATGVFEGIYFGVLLAAAIPGSRALRTFEARRHAPTLP
jgi:hypothetical protein